MSPLSVEQQAVVDTTAPVEESSPEFIKEWVRFWFHGLGISLCGILTFSLPDWLACGLLLFFVAWFAWYELVRSSSKLQDVLSNWLLWPLTSWMVWATRKIKVRPHEIGTRASSLDFFLGFVIAWAICPSYIMATACFVTAWCDPFARVVGRNFGKRKWPFSKKTFMGSSACWLVATVVAFVCLMVLGGMPKEVALSGSIVTGLSAAIVELIPQFPRKPKPGDILSPADNFSIILTVSLVLTLWHHAFSQASTLI